VSDLPEGFAKEGKHYGVRTLSEYVAAKCTECLKDFSPEGEYNNPLISDWVLKDTDSWMQSHRRVLKKYFFIENLNDLVFERALPYP
jgi:hypothetical protein